MARVLQRRSLKMAAISERPLHSASADSRLRENLRRLRHERGLTLNALSDRSLVSRAMISKIERGAAVPTATVLGELAALWKSVSRLVGRSPGNPCCCRGPNRRSIAILESGLERRSFLLFSRIVGGLRAQRPSRRRSRRISGHSSGSRNICMSTAAI